MHKLIEIRFEDYKRLVQLMRSPTDTEADVLSRLLDAEFARSSSGKMEQEKSTTGFAETKGLLIKGIALPEGTQLVAHYKGRSYHHKIVDGRWVDSIGVSYDSPSSAARSITGNNVNGWRFWHAMRPGDTQWSRLEQLGVL